MTAEERAKSLFEITRDRDGDWYIYVGGVEKPLWMNRDRSVVMADRKLLEGIIAAAIREAEESMKRRCAEFAAHWMGDKEGLSLQRNIEKEIR